MKSFLVLLCEYGGFMVAWRICSRNFIIFAPYDLWHVAWIYRITRFRGCGTRDVTMLSCLPWLPCRLVLEFDDSAIHPPEFHQFSIRFCKERPFLPSWNCSEGLDKPFEGFRQNCLLGLRSIQHMLDMRVT